MEQSQSSDPKMTAEQVRTWLRDWVMRTTGLPEEDVTDDKAMETFGLSSRDVVVLSGELENLLDVTLDATIAYEYPTIRGLAQRLIDGEPERSNIKPELNFTAIDSARATTTSLLWVWQPVSPAQKTPRRCGSCSSRAAMASVSCRSAAGLNMPVMRSCPARWRNTRAAA